MPAQQLHHYKLTILSILYLLVGPIALCRTVIEGGASSRGGRGPAGLPSPPSPSAVGSNSEAPSGLVVR